MPAFDATQLLNSPLLPELRKDPFDHILIAQATAEGISLLTTDPLWRNVRYLYGQPEAAWVT